MCNSDSGDRNFSPRSTLSPYAESPSRDKATHLPKHGLIGSLCHGESHIYSLSSSMDFIFTGSESKEIKIWKKNMEEFSKLKSSSGLVKAIVVLGNKIFTGHQDGKIRVWRFSGDRKNGYRRIGSLPKSQDLLIKSINPKSYVEVRRKRNVPWIKHYDAVSCLTADVKNDLLYSGSWDKTVKVWRITDSKCLESIPAHDDAVNSVVAAGDGLIFTGSADGTVKAWRRDFPVMVDLKGRQASKIVESPLIPPERGMKHVLVDILLKQDHALTSLAMSHEPKVVYAGSSDGLVSFWEILADHNITYGGVIRGHKVAVLCVAIAGNLVLSGSADRSICVWRRGVGGEHDCVAVLKGHDGPVKCLTVAGEEEDGGGRSWVVYSGSLDKSVKIWRVSEG